MMGQRSKAGNRNTGLRFSPAHVSAELLDDDAFLLRGGGEAGTNVFHPVGTCKMGTDPMAVVDPRLRVHGIAGLRVIDASIMPAVTTGNTNAPTIMIGEKGAAMIKEDTRAGLAAAA